VKGGAEAINPLLIVGWGFFWLDDLFGLIQRLIRIVEAEYCERQWISTLRQMSIMISAGTTNFGDVGLYARLKAASIDQFPSL